jgi:hypothetical protein
MEKKPEEEVLEEKVIEAPVEVKEEDVAPLEAPQSDVLKEAHDVLCAWHELYKVEQPKADDTFYYAEELWVEDEKFWDHGKHKVTRGEWTVEQFDEELEKLRKKQQPVWDKLLKQADEIAAILEKPAADVNASAEKVKASIGPHPLQKYVGRPAPTKQEAEVRHEYHWKLHQEFEDAKAQYQEICGYPEGLLSRVKLFRINVVREDISITEYIHSDKKTVGKLFKNLPLLGKTGA